MTARFRCRHCNYEFSPKSKNVEQPPARCPYCGTTGSVDIKKHVLEEL